MDRRSSYSKVSSSHRSGGYDHRHSTSSATKDHFERRSDFRKEPPAPSRSSGRNHRYEGEKRKYSEPSDDYRHSKSEHYGTSGSHRYRDGEPTYKRARPDPDPYEGRSHLRSAHHYESRYETPPTRSHRHAPASYKKPAYSEAEPRKPRPLLPPEEERRILKAKAHPVRHRGGGGVGRGVVTGKPIRKGPPPPRRPRRDELREASESTGSTKKREKEKDELGDYEGDENQDLDEEEQKDDQPEGDDEKTDKEERSDSRSDKKDQENEEDEAEEAENEGKKEGSEEVNGNQKEKEEDKDGENKKRPKDEDAETREEKKKKERNSKEDASPSKGSKLDREQRAGSKDKSDYIRLQCPHCHLRCLTFSTYVNHLSSQRHLDALQKLSQQHRLSLATLRSRQRREQAQMEAQNVKPVRQEQMNFCAICKLYHSESRPNHEATELHKIIKNFLMPFCPICRIAFKSRMLYEKHVATLTHVKAKANMEKMYERRREEAKSAKDRGEEHEDVEELDPSNMLTLDAVGNFDDNGEEPLIGDEYVKKLTVLYCEVCKRYLARTDPLEKALAIHCKSALHLKEARRTQDEEKDRALREEEERSEANKGAENGADEEAKAGEREEEEEEKKDEDQEEKLWEEEGPEFMDGEETNDGEKPAEVEESQDAWENERVVKEREDVEGEEEHGEGKENGEKAEDDNGQEARDKKDEEEEDHVVMEIEGAERADGL